MAHSLPGSRSGTPRNYAGELGLQRGNLVDARAASRGSTPRSHHPHMQHLELQAMQQPGSEVLISAAPLRHGPPQYARSPRSGQDLSSRPQDMMEAHMPAQDRPFGVVSRWESGTLADEQDLTQNSAQRFSGAPLPIDSAQRVQVRNVPVDVDKLDIVSKDKEVVYYDLQPVERVVESDRIREHVSTYPHQVPRFVERTITKDVPVPNFVLQDKIVDKAVIREVWKDKEVIKEIPVTVERVVIKEVPVYEDKIVDRIVYKEVYVDKVITKEVPVEVEKIEYREVEVLVDKVVDRIVDVPFETVVYKDKIEFVDKVIYNDIRKEVPVDRRNTGTSEPQVQFSKNQRAMQRFGPGELPNRRTPRKVGLGLVLRHDEDKQVFVKEIVKGFAAERQGGLQAHDVIVAVDGSNLDGLDLEEIKHLTVGDEGSVVRLLLRRAGRELTVMLERIAGDPMRREPRESTPMSPHQPQLVAMGGRSNSSPQQME